MKSGPLISGIRPISTYFIAATFFAKIAMFGGSEAMAQVSNTTDAPRETPETRARPADSADAGGQRGEMLWTIHGIRNYRVAQTPRPPVIDGRLDDEVWQRAPVESRFVNALSKPYAQPIPEPTSVQVAYDDQNIYVAFRCSYSKPGERDDKAADDGPSFYAGESVGVAIDGRHDHSNSRAFGVNRMGSRQESDRTLNATIVNYDWDVVWTSAVQASQESWTVEYAIPWASAGVPSHDRPFTIGINFHRNVPNANMAGIWAPQPPSPNSQNTSFMGHLEIPTGVSPGDQLFVQPYVTGAIHQNKLQSFPRLTDFTATDGTANVYGGAYVRYRPNGVPLQIDGTINPDFSAVSPDQAITNLSRFEVAYPETRPFFGEDRGRFEFGTEDASLFYSRRIGLQRAEGVGRSQPYFQVPIFSGVKALMRDGGSEVAAMNIEASKTGKAGTNTPLADNVTIARFNHFFGDGYRVGNIFLARSGQVGGFASTGIDGAITMMNQNLVLSGFAATSATSRPAPTDFGAGPTRPAKGLAGDLRLKWDSADFEYGLEYLALSSEFDGQLGFVPKVGIYSLKANVGYTPIIHNDWVREVDIRASIDRTRSVDDSLLHDHAVLQLQSILLNRSLLSFELLPETEGVQTPFSIGGGRIYVGSRTYNGYRAQMSIKSPPRRTVAVELSYLQGDLYGGYERVPSILVGLNFRKFYTSALYKLYSIRPLSGASVSGHQVNASATYQFAPLFNSSLFVQANTLDDAALVKLVTSWIFGKLSSLSLTLSQSGINVEVFARRPVRTGLLSFAYGFAIF